MTDAPQTYSGNPIPPLSKDSSKGKLILLAIALVLIVGLIVLLLIMFFGLLKYSTSKPEVITTAFPTNAITVTSTPEPSTELGKLNIAENEMMLDDQPYPETLTSLSEDALIGFSCGEFYNYQYDPPVYVYWETEQITSVDEAIQLDDPLLLDFLTSYNNENPEPISAVQKCELGTNKTLLLLNSASGGGGMDSVVLVGYFENNQLVSEATIKNKGEISAPYFSFNKLLAVSKENYAYLTVWGGDAWFGRVALMKVNLSDGNVPPEPIYICTLQAVDLDPNNIPPMTETTCTSDF